MCSNKYQMSLIQSTYMAGVLAGALVLSELSDKWVKGAKEKDRRIREKVNEKEVKEEREEER